MADSKDIEDTSSDDFSDELDEMLNEAESLNQEQEEMIDDEDAIDRLLMDDVFDGSEEKQTMAEQEEVDEFAEDDPFESVIEGAMAASNETEDKTADFDVDDLVDSIETDNSSENELAEIDEFNEDEIIAENTEVAEKPVKENVEPDNESSDDFLISDFDISAEDDEISEDDEIVEIENNPVAENSVPENSVPETIQQVADTNSAVSPETIADIALAKAAIDELNAQISQLWADNENFKHQITELNDAASSNQNDAIVKDLENLQLEQRQLKRSLKDSAGNVPVVTYVALGIAILALLIGGGLGAIGYGAQSEVTELTDLVTSLEEEIEIMTAKDSSADFKTLNSKINLLIAKDEDLSKQLIEAKKAQKSSRLKPVVDDLVEQNDHAQQVIDQLVAKVETLEKRKFVSASTRKSKKAVAKVTWVVNLVSFKQQWYAKRKATEFAKKGIPAQVVKAKVNDQIWYRLSVTGFKTKYEAAAYAVKVKKTLNLSSVWVTKAK